MSAIEQLESLNPVPDYRGNPGSPVHPRRQRRRLPKLAAAFGVAVALALVTLTLDQRSGDPADVVVTAAQLDERRSQGDATESLVPRLTPDAVIANTEPSQFDEVSPLVVARLIIPSIEADLRVVQGVSAEALRLGPGHYPTTPFPGQAGNAVIAGHRTTYGAPFHRIDELAVGDSVFVKTSQGVFEYLVRAEQIVDPDEVAVVSDFDDNRLSLTTGHPKYSNSQRLVVIAELVGEPAERVAVAALPPEDESG